MDGWLDCKLKAALCWIDVSQCVYFYLYYKKKNPQIWICINWNVCQDFSCLFIADYSITLHLFVKNDFHESLLDKDYCFPSLALSDWITGVEEENCKSAEQLKYDSVWFCNHVKPFSATVTSPFSTGLCYSSYLIIPTIELGWKGCFVLFFKLLL